MSAVLQHLPALLTAAIMVGYAVATAWGPFR